MRSLAPEVRAAIEALTFEDIDAMLKKMRKAADVRVGQPDALEGSVGEVTERRWKEVMRVALSSAPVLVSDARE